MAWVGTKTQINERNSKTCKCGWSQCMGRNIRIQKFCKIWHCVSVQILVGEILALVPCTTEQEISEGVEVQLLHLVQAIASYLKSNFSHLYQLIPSMISLACIYVQHSPPHNVHIFPSNYSYSILKYNHIISRWLRHSDLSATYTETAMLRFVWCISHPPSNKMTAFGR